MKKIITLLFLGWLITFSTTAQVVYNVSPSSSSADPGETIFIDVTVENFIDMIGFQFEMEWNDQVLQFQEITTYGNIMCNIAGNPSVCYSYPSAFGPASITNFFVTQYLDPDFINPTANTLADGEKLLTIEFLVVGQAGQSSPIDFRGAILAVDSNFNELSVANGMVIANNGTFNVNGTGCAGAGDVTFTASNESGDTGTSGSVKVSVDNFENVEGFGFTINWDPSIISFTSIGNLNLTGLTNPSPPAVGSFGTSQASNGNLFVSWSNSSGVTACDGDIIFEIFYDIIGAGQTSTDVDFTGNIEVIRNSQLVPHAVNSGSVMVTGNGTGQQTGITFIAEDVTGESGTQVCVPIKVANFDQVISFQYDVTWDPAIISFATILDGSGQPLSPIGSGNPLGLLNPNPPAIGNFGSTNSSNGVLSLSWDNGSGVTLTDQTPIYQICYDIIGATSEISQINFGGTIEVADINGLADFTGVSGSVEVIEVFNGGLNLEWDCCEKANPGENICVDVRVVDGFEDILSAQYGMLWDNTVLTFESIAFGNGNPLGLSVGNNLVYDANADAVKLLWFDNSGQGVSLNPGTSLYQICYDVTGATGTNGDLEMGPIPAAIPPFTVEISNNLNTIAFLGNSCNVAVENILPLTIIETVTSPTCVGDTDGAINVIVSGGVEEYTYIWSTTSSSQDISDLVAGDYTVTVTDCKGDTAEKTITVADPTPVTATANITEVSGVGNSDGEIDLMPSGGTPNYTYVWSNGSIIEDLTGLPIGIYTVTITDTNGCTGVESFEVPNSCNPLTVTVTSTDENCAGQNDGSATASGSGGVGNYIYTWSNSLPTGPTVSGLAPGVYSVTATDDDGCTGSTSFSIGNGANLLVNIVSTTDLICFGENTGSIEISGFGGSGSYSVVWQPGGMTDLVISDLAAGSYTPVITDTNTGCTATGNAIVLTEPSEITMSGSVTNTSCNAGSDGSISLSISGGTSSYSVAWSNGSVGQTLNSLPAGTYTPTVTDGNGCVKVGAGITVGEPSSITSIPTIDGTSCFGECDGSISLNISGGTPGYTVIWSNGETGTSLSNLCAGNYSAIIQDAIGCTFSEVYSVTQPALFGLDFAVQHESPIGNDGAINLTVSPIGNYNFLWSNGATTEDINGLTADIYNVTVTDIVSGCTTIGGAAVTNTLAIQSELLTHVTCHDGNDGSVEITISGGTPGYTYVWSSVNGPFAITKDVFGLTAGTYTVEVTDLAMTTITETYIIIEPTPVTITNVIIFDESDICDGSINITPNGGTGPYTYQWSIPQQSQDLVDLCEGSYNVTVTDSKGCTFVSPEYIIEPSSPQVGNVDITDVSCFSDTDGVICIDIVGGNAPYTVTINNFNPQISTATTVCFGGLSPSDYVIQITDAQGLFVSSTIYTVGEPDPITIAGASIINETISGCDGGVNIMDVQGGNGGYSYLWSNGDISQDLGSVCSGFYQLTITDVNGCTFVTEEFEIVKLLSYEILITNVACFDEENGSIDLDVFGGLTPYTYVWTDSNGTVIGGNSSTLENQPAGQYGVVVTDGAGTILSLLNLFTIGQPTNPLEVTSTLTVQPSPADCDGGEISIVVIGGTTGYSYDWTNQDGVNVGNTPTITGLIGGIYTALVTDGNGCTTTVEAELFECQITLNVNLISELTVSCFGETDGMLSVVATGGTEPYTYDWDYTSYSETGIDGSSLDNLAPGTYEITATDFYGVTTIESYIISEPTPIQVSVTVSPGRAEAIVLGGTAPFTYQWDQTITTDSFIEGLQGGIEHVLLVIDDNGCTSEIQRFNLDYDTGCFEARAVITPNNDGLNDNFYVNCLESTTVRVIIFNRWGQEVYENNDYDNSFIGLGKRDEILPQGGYFYVLNYLDTNGAFRTSKGSLSIVR